jgi:hypothetical protein
MTIVLFPNPRQARLMKVTFPNHFSPQPPDRALSVRFRQQPQPRFHGSPFRPGAAAPHCLPHQPVINVNICSHA